MAQATAIQPSEHALAHLSIQTTASTAANKVFNTPELLEHILLQMPRLEILLLKRTNSTFRDTIDSPILLEHTLLGHARGVRSEQQLTWFHAVHLQPEDRHTYPDLTSIELNRAPLLAQSPSLTDDYHNRALYCLRLNSVHIECPFWYRNSTQHAEAHLDLPVVEPADFDYTEAGPVKVRRVGRPTMRKVGLQDRFGTQWQQLKLLRVACPVKIVIAYHSRGLLFSPQQDPLRHWHRANGEVSCILSAEDANLGQLLLFWDQVMSEYIRVNSGENSAEYRSKLRREAEAA
ncbi:hypothetical protein B0A48_04179 [Cryoendolithus antarcticus]|uniref:F-box domain-containing protein n=1 Tax=Cryoendolithus antarcticus TaxID=1507870 RepID=A0A1V8TI09_9PEZI|nr:hypothetical protein B0A48_04179 [Cryoendolithus antarcticus]